MKRFGSTAMIGVLAIMLTGCFSIVNIEERHKGRIVSAETGEPVPGVVVIGEWVRNYPNVGGSSSECYDSIETVTDKKGDFSLPGSLRAFSNVGPMDVVIFKAGYKTIGGTWRAFKYSKSYKEKIKWEEGRAIIPLEKESQFEMRYGFDSPPSDPCGCSEEKTPNFIKEKRRLRIMIFGLEAVMKEEKRQKAIMKEQN